MTLTTNVAQLKARLSEYLRHVRTGTDLIVTERGRPVARVVALNDAERREDRRSRLVRAGVLRAGRGRVRRSLLEPPPGRRTGDSVLDALIDERRGGR